MAGPKKTLHDEFDQAEDLNAAFDAAPESRPAPEPVPDEGPESFSPESASGTALRGFGQGASFGFSDELSGLSRVPAAAGVKLGQALGKAVGWESPGAVNDLGERLGVKGIGGKSAVEALRAAYLSGRNEARQENQQSKEAHPVGYTVAELAGGLAVPVPGAAAAKPMQFGKYALTKTGQRALIGAGTGAAMGAGYGSADFVDSSPEAQQKGGGFAGDVVPSAALGAVLGPLGGAAGDRLAIYLKRKAQENALKSIGLRAGISNALEQRGYETVDEGRQLGQAALDMDLIPFGGTAESVAKRAAEVKPRYGAMIEDALGQADAAEKLTPLAGNSSLVEPLGFDYARAAQQAASSAQGPKGLTAAALDASGPAAKNLDQIRRQAALDSSFEAANRLKSNMYEGINYATDPKLSTKLQRQVAGGLRQSIEDQVADAAGTEAADQLRTANQRWGQLADISSLAGDEATRQAGRKNLTAMDIAMAAMGGSAGHAAGGAGGGFLGAAAPLAAKVLGPRMPSLFARTQQAVAPVAGSLASGAVRAVQTRSADLSEEERRSIAAFLDGGG